jgi:hypothetical protein
VTRTATWPDSHCQAARSLVQALRPNMGSRTPTTFQNASRDKSEESRLFRTVLGKGSLVRAVLSDLVPPPKPDEQAPRHVLDGPEVKGEEEHDDHKRKDKGGCEPAGAAQAVSRHSSVCLAAGFQSTPCTSSRGVGSAA